MWLYRPEASWSAGCPKCSNPMEPVEVWPEGTVAKLREVRDILALATPPEDDWWCPTCRTALSGSRVTHDERCDTCGTYLGHETQEWVAAARAALSATEAKG